MSDRVPLKDQLFNSAKVEQVAREIAAAAPGFRAGRFVADVLGRFPELELKARIGWMAQCLDRHLPGRYRHTVEVILASLPPPNDPTRSDGDFGDFIYAPYAEYVARRGCTPADATYSLAALRGLTMRFSAEDAIRPFINRFPELTLRTLQQWAGDDHYQVRRLCSEGTRPLLPWSRRLDTPADYAVDLLVHLHADPTRFVTRSVANHVNDLSKLDADLVLALLRDWLDAGRQEAAELGYIVRHATRTLVKQGHPGALELVGVRPDAQVLVEAVDVPATAVLGDALTFSVTLLARRPTDAIVDYALRFASPGGGLTRRRVYKLERLALEAGEPVTLTKRHALPPGMTTVPLYPGGHELQVQVNGRVVGTWPFTLLASSSTPRAR